MRRCLSAMCWCSDGHCKLADRGILTNDARDVSAVRGGWVGADLAGGSLTSFAFRPRRPGSRTRPRRRLELLNKGAAASSNSPAGVIGRGLGKYGRHQSAKRMIQYSATFDLDIFGDY